jgi:hypothetical protein
VVLSFKKISEPRFGCAYQEWWCDSELVDWRKISITLSFRDQGILR